MKSCAGKDGHPGGLKEQANHKGVNRRDDALPLSAEARTHGVAREHR